MFSSPSFSPGRKQKTFSSHTSQHWQVTKSQEAQGNCSRLKHSPISPRPNSTRFHLPVSDCSPQEWNRLPTSTPKIRRVFVDLNLLWVTINLLILKFFRGLEILAGSQNGPGITKKTFALSSTHKPSEKPCPGWS